MERVTNQRALAICLLTVLFAGCVDPRARDAAYVQDVLLPAITDFSRQQGLHLTNALTTNRLTLCKIHRVKKRPAISSSLRIDGRYAFSFLDENGQLSLNHFELLPPVWNSDYSSVPPEKRKIIEQWPNTLTGEAARELLLRHFTLAGHREMNFHAVIFHQIIWRQPPTNQDGLLIISGPGAERGTLLRLPFYQASWFRRDVDMKAYYQGDVMQPLVQLVVSGVDRKLISYSRLFMPFEGGDWGKAAPQPAHPNSTTNSP